MVLMLMMNVLTFMDDDTDHDTDDDDTVDDTDDDTNDDTDDDTDLFIFCTKFPLVAGEKSTRHR